MFRFENLEIWKEALNFSEAVYSVIKNFPKEEVFALTDQLRRASVSIPTNIAEGSSSNSNKEFKHYLNIAIKSIFEVVSLLVIAKNNSYISKEKFEELYRIAEFLAKRIQSFRNSLK